MTEPPVSALYERALKERGGIYVPGAHDAAISFAADQMGWTKERVIDALRRYWTMQGAG